MKPFFSVITPSLQRQSLIKCCQSVTTQSYDSWEQIVQIDCTEINKEIFAQIDHSQRWVYLCGERHGHYGNHCRHIAWEKTTGEYLVMLDDDNFLAHKDTLRDIAKRLEAAQYPDFAIFPIHRHGSIFFNDPPGLCQTDTANVVVKRDIGRWPDIEAREADGHWVDALKAKYKYAAFPNVRPIIIMEYSSNGI